MNQRNNYKSMNKKLEHTLEYLLLLTQESYLMNQKFDEMKVRIKQLEDDRDQLLENTKLTLSVIHTKYLANRN